MAKALGFDWFLGSSSLLNNNSPLLRPGDAKLSTPSGVNPSGIFPGKDTNALNSSPIRITGLLTEAQMGVVVRALETRKNVNIITAPRVTSLSGRQVEIFSLDNATVVTGLDLVTNASGTVTQNFTTDKLPFGPVLNLIPDVSEDGFSIRLTLMAKITSFVGYDTSEPPLPNAITQVSVRVPRPIFERMNQRCHQ